jgi:hypothetical protein
MSTGCQRHSDYLQCCNLSISSVNCNVATFVLSWFNDHEQCTSSDICFKQMLTLCVWSQCSYKHVQFFQLNINHCLYCAELFKMWLWHHCAVAVKLFKTCLRHCCALALELFKTCLSHHCALELELFRTCLSHHCAVPVELFQTCLSHHCALACKLLEQFSHP